MIFFNEDGNAKQTPIYSWKKATVEADGTAAATDITDVTGFGNLFKPFVDAGNRKPYKIKVLSTAAAYIKINGGDVITIGATTPFEAEDLKINSIGVSSGGAEASITVYLQ